MPLHDKDSVREFLEDEVYASVEPDAAQRIISELGALVLFLKRMRALKEVDKHLDVLTDEDALQLEADLADPSYYGMEKSLFMTGKNTGFDMTRQDGLEHLRLAFNASAIAGSTEDLGGSTEAAAQARSDMLVQQAVTTRGLVETVASSKGVPSARAWCPCCRFHELGDEDPPIVYCRAKAPVRRAESNTSGTRLVAP